MYRWNANLKPLAIALFASTAGLISGCATVTTGSTQSITISTIPEGATCLMVREDETIGAINGTPGTVTVDKDKDPISIECTLAGHMETIESIESNFQGATLGNVILGGVIGIAIDAGSGAMNKYPTSVELVLIPESFATVEERDEFFNKILAKLDEQAEIQLKKVEQQCGDDEFHCDEQRKKVEDAATERRKSLEQKRSAAKIG